MKQVLTIGLLLFVAVSLVYFAAEEVRSRGKDSVPVSPPESLSDRVVVYYFHGNVRCKTCNAIEDYAEESIRSAFPREMERGEVAWVVENMEAPENEHFVERYELAFSSLVVSRVEGGEEADWTNMERVWDLVGRREEFLQYVQNQVRVYLGRDEWGNGF